MPRNWHRKWIPLLGGLLILAGLVLAAGTADVVSSSTASLRNQLTNGYFSDASNCTSNVAGWTVVSEGGLGVLVMNPEDETGLPTCARGFLAGDQVAARLGVPVKLSVQPESGAALHQQIAIPPPWENPTLAFRYRIITHDITGWSSFRAEIRDIQNQPWALVLEDGCDDVPGECPGGIARKNKDLGWKTVKYDLTPFRGQLIRVWFESRNKFDTALGIWAYLDDVLVFDARFKANLPLIMNNVGAASSVLEAVEPATGVPRPPTPTPIPEP